MAKITLYTANRDLEYEELSRGLSEHYSDDAQMANRIIACAWDQRYIVRDDFLGWSENVGGKLSRYIPEIYPDDNTLFCVDVQMVDVEGAHSQAASGLVSGGLVKYENAVMKATYRSLPWRIIDDDQLDNNNEANRYVIRTRNFSFEQQSVPGTDFRFDGDYGNAPIGQVPALPFDLIAMDYTVKGIPPELIPDLLAFSNCVNSTLFDNNTHCGGNSFGGYPVQSVLFTGAKERNYWNSRGRFVSDLTYTFVMKNGSESWQKILGQDARLHKIVRVSDPSKSLFETAELNDLFVFTE